MSADLNLGVLDRLLNDLGPEALESAVNELDGPVAAAAARAVAAAVHLLRPVSPAYACSDVLLSRLALEPALQEQVEAYEKTLPPRSRLSNRRVPAPHPALRRVLTDPDLNVWGIGSVAIAPDGAWVATGTFEGCARTWDPVTGRVRTVMIGHRGGVNHIAIAPDGSWMATGGVDGTVRIWDATTGEARAVLCHDDPPQRVQRVAIAPDGTWLAAGDYDGTVRIWAVASDTLRMRLTGLDGVVNAIAVAADGSRLTVAARDVRTWDTTTWQEVEGQDEPVPTEDRAWVGGDWVERAVAPDGSWVATTAGCRHLQIWDVAGFDAVPVDDGEQGVATVDRDGLLVMRHDRFYWPSASPGEVRAADTEELVWTLPGGPCRFGAAAPDRSWIALIADGQVRIWDPVTGVDRAVLSRGRGGYAKGVAVTADGSRVVAWWHGSVDPIVMWDVAGTGSRSTFKAHRTGVTGVRVAPDGSWLAVTTNDWHVRIVDVATGRSRRPLKGTYKCRLASVDIAPDGTWLAVPGENRTVLLFDAITVKRRMALYGHTDEVTAIAISPDSRHVAAVDEDGTLLVWRASEAEPVAAMRTDVKLDGCAWLPDGSGVCVTGAGQSMVYSFTP